VAERQRVPDLVRDHELHEAAHERVGEGELLHARVEVPTCEKYHDRCRFMMLWNICTSASRISPLRGSTVLGPTAFSVADGQPAHHAHVRVLAAEDGRRVARHRAGDDALLEAGGLERGLPLLDAAARPLDEPRGRGRVDVVRDRALRVAEVPLAPLRALEAPAVDEPAAAHALLARAEVGALRVEEADALVVQARLHRHVGEPDERVVVELRPRGRRPNRAASGLGCAGSCGAAWKVCEASISTFAG
jgi:hypothetical protein